MKETSKTKWSEILLTLRGIGATPFANYAIQKITLITLKNQIDLFAHLAGKKRTKMLNFMNQPIQITKQQQKTEQLHCQIHPKVTWNLTLLMGCIFCEECIDVINNELGDCL